MKKKQIMKEALGKMITSKYSQIKTAFTKIQSLNIDLS